MKITEEYELQVQPSAIYQSEIVTYQRYAGFLTRLIASIIDGVILMVIAVIPLAIIAFFSISIASENQSLIYPAIFTIIIAGLVISWLYEAWFESSKYMGTPGKMICGLRVIDLEGRRITFRRATIRFIIKSAIPALLRSVINNALGGLYLIIDTFIMRTNNKKQCLHDIVAGTIVVHV